MSKRWLVVLTAAVAVSCFASAVVLAQDQAPAATQTHVAQTSSTLAPDPFLGGEIATQIPLARFCEDYGQCTFTLPPGTPCSEAKGCVCGY
jgi:hypothetical protein